MYVWAFPGHPRDSTYWGLITAGHCCEEKLLLRSFYSERFRTCNHAVLPASSQGKLSDAEPLYECCQTVDERILTRSEARTFGRSAPPQGCVVEHLFLRSYACILRPFVSKRFVAFQGRLDEAGPLYDRSLAIREKALGPDHPDVAVSLNNRAGLLSAQVRAARVFSEYSYGAR